MQDLVPWVDMQQSLTLFFVKRIAKANILSLTRSECRDLSFSQFFQIPNPPPPPKADQQLHLKQSRQLTNTLVVVISRNTP